MQIVETNYNQVIQSLKDKLSKIKINRKISGYEQTIGVRTKNELENLFQTSVDETRKQITKRKLKTEVNLKRRYSTVSPEHEELEFEQSLNKLADMGKNKIKFEDFTVIDKVNMLDLFVNNEKVLMRIYDCLFPKEQTDILLDQNYYIGTPLAAADTSVNSVV